MRAHPACNPHDVAELDAGLADVGVSAHATDDGRHVALVVVAVFLAFIFVTLLLVVLLFAHAAGFRLGMSANLRDDGDARRRRARPRPDPRTAGSYCSRGRHGRFRIRVMQIREVPHHAPLLLCRVVQQTRPLVVIWQFVLVHVFRPGGLVFILAAGTQAGWSIAATLCRCTLAALLGFRELALCPFVGKGACTPGKRQTSSAQACLTDSQRVQARTDGPSCST